MQTTATSIVNLFLPVSDKPQATHIPCPHKSLVWPFWINKDPGVCLKCAHTMCSVCVCACKRVCVCICAHRICSSLQQRKEVTRWWGFQNGAAAVEEACALYVFFSPPLSCALFLFCLFWYCFTSLLKPRFWEGTFNCSLQWLSMETQQYAWQMHLCVINFMNSKYGTSFRNGLLAVNIHLVRHALCNLIGWGRQRLLISTKGLEQKERAPEERRRFRWEWKLNTHWRLLLTNSRRYKVYGHVRATTNF